MEVAAVWFNDSVHPRKKYHLNFFSGCLNQNVSIDFLVFDQSSINKTIRSSVPPLYHRGVLRPKYLVTYLPLVDTKCAGRGHFENCTTYMLVQCTIKWFACSGRFQYNKKWSTYSMGINHRIMISKAHPDLAIPSHFDAGFCDPQNLRVVVIKSPHLTHCL